MTLSPAEIAALDQLEAKWSEWFGTLSEVHVRKILDLGRKFIKGSLKEREDRSLVHDIFLMGMHRLQVVSQIAKEMK